MGVCGDRRRRWASESMSTTLPIKHGLSHRRSEAERSTLGILRRDDVRRSRSPRRRSATGALAAGAHRRCDPSRAAMKAWLAQGGGAERPAGASTRKRAASSAAGGEPATVAGLEHEAVHDRDRARPAWARGADRDQGDERRDSSTSDGVLRGSLYLEGGGDPALGTPRLLRALPRRARDQPLRAEGADPRGRDRRGDRRLYADDTIFDRLRGVADSGFATSPYIGPLSGLAFDSGYSGPRRHAASPPTRRRLAAATLARALRAAGVAIPARPALQATPASAERVAMVALADRLPARRRHQRPLQQLLSPRRWSSCSARGSAAPAPPPRGRPWSTRFARGSAPASTRSTAPG